MRRIIQRRRRGRRQFARSLKPPARLDRSPPGPADLIAELLLDPDQLIVFRQAIRAGERTGLDLSTLGCGSEIGNGRILGLTRPMGHHGPDP